MPVNIAVPMSFVRCTDPVFHEFADTEVGLLKAEYEAAITPLPVPTIATPAAIRPESRPMRRVIFSIASPENVRATGHPSRPACMDDGRRDDARTRWNRDLHELTRAPRADARGDPPYFALASPGGAAPVREGAGARGAARRAVEERPEEGRRRAHQHEAPSTEAVDRASVQRAGAARCTAAAQPSARWRLGDSNP
ncbi:hypothetical protein GCM10009869_12150 [Amnibacterium kyonggiense]